MWEEWIIWLLIGAVLIIIELGTGALVALCVGVGALCASAAALAGGGLAWQLGVCAVCMVLSFIYLAPLVRRYKGRLYSKSADYNSNMDAMIGRIGMVEEAYRGPGTYGRMRLDGGSWQIVNHDAAAPLPRGTKVRVTAYHSIILTVVALPDA